MFLRYSPWTHRTRAFPYVRGDVDALEPRSTPKGEPVLSET